MVFTGNCENVNVNDVNVNVIIYINENTNKNIFTAIYNFSKKKKNDI